MSVDGRFHLRNTLLGIFCSSVFFAIGMVHFSLAFTYENPVARFCIVMVMVTISLPVFVFFHVLILVIVIVTILDIVIASSYNHFFSLRRVFVIVIVIAIVIISFLTALVFNISWRIKLSSLNVGRSSGQFFQQSDITLYLRKKVR